MCTSSILMQVAVGFVKECGALLQDFSPQGLHGERDLVFSANCNFILLMYAWGILA